MERQIKALDGVNTVTYKTKEQALEYGHSRVREICFLATHGILHLLGYDHMNEDDEEKMFSLQNELLDGYDIKR